jgi:[ribosomal protein S18]-alanine N-acetyltransferase
MGAEPLIRPMRDSDADAVACIQAAAQEASQWDPRGYLAFEAFVVEVEGEVAGFAVSRRTAPDEAEILNVAVAPRWRRRGLARLLIERATPAEARALFLEVRESNEAARAFYRAAGFTEYGRRPDYYSHPLEAAILMRRDVPA